MKRVIMLAHCILNGFCDLDVSDNTLRREVMDVIDKEDTGVIQLPCPELCYQALERTSIEPGDSRSGKYEEYCRDLLADLFKTLREYHKHDVEILGMLGIENSPSCSAEDDSSIMCRIIKEELEKSGIEAKIISDIPESAEARHDYIKMLSDELK